MADRSTNSGAPDFVIHGRPHLMSSYHRHNDIEINYLERGSMTYLFSRGRREVPEGGFAVFWAMFPHRVVTVDDDTSFYCLHIPLARFLQWRLPAEFVGDVLHGNIVVDRSPSIAAVDQARFPLWYDELSEAQSPTSGRRSSSRSRRACVRREWRRRCAASMAPAQRRSRPDPVGTDKLGGMTAFIAERYTEDVTPLPMSPYTLGLHPKYAMSLFPQGVRGHDDGRICHATSHLTRPAICWRRQISRSSTRPSMPALAQSVSAFYDAFARVCRCTPSQFRKTSDWVAFDPDVDSRCLIFLISRCSDGGFESGENWNRNFSNAMWIFANINHNGTYFRMLRSYVLIIDDRAGFAQRHIFVGPR